MVFFFSILFKDIFIYTFVIKKLNNKLIETYSLLLLEFYGICINSTQLLSYDDKNNSEKH